MGQQFLLIIARNCYYYYISWLYSPSLVSLRPPSTQRGSAILQQPLVECTAHIPANNKRQQHCHLLEQRQKHLRNQERFMGQRFLLIIARNCYFWLQVHLCQWGIFSGNWWGSFLVYPNDVMYSVVWCVLTGDIYSIHTHSVRIISWKERLYLNTSTPSSAHTFRGLFLRNLPTIFYMTGWYDEHLWVKITMRMNSSISPYLHKCGRKIM